MFERSLGAMNGWRGGAGALTACGVAGAPLNAGTEPLSVGIGSAAVAALASRATSVRMWRILPRPGIRCAASMKTSTLLLALIAAIVLAAPAAADVQPYGTNDAGGFRNMLPPGEAGTDNILQLGAFEATGTAPAHFFDQQPLYNGLLFASPTLTHDDVAKYFKDATFGVRPGDVESTESPRPGVIIVRDKGYGIPHIYGATDDDVEFGAGYAGAEDRLFLMDVLRHTARAQLSSFIGGSPGNREMDRTQWAIAPYTEDDLQKQIDLAPTVYGDAGRQLVERGNAFVDGINAYIHSALSNPTKLPGEYAALGKTPADWSLRDVIAEASLIGGIFGKGGGNELRSALLLQSLEKRFGTQKGRHAWHDFRSKNDPEAPTTILKKRFPYETTQRVRQARAGTARPGLGAVHARRAARPGGVARHRLGRRADGARVQPAPARVQLGADQRARVRDRPRDRRARPAGRLLRAADPHGGGPARPALRRTRRRRSRA